jgi:hypothetical protein
MTSDGARSEISYLPETAAFAGLAVTCVPGAKPTFIT